MAVQFHRDAAATGDSVRIQIAVTVVGVQLVVDASADAHVSTKFPPSFKGVWMDAE
jgi:hypothetical protein